MNPCPGCALAEPGPAGCCRDWAVGVTAAEARALAGAVVETAAHGWRYVGELRRTLDGACVFLRETGCGIYDRRPQACREFGKSCRLGPGAATARGTVAAPMVIEWKIPCELCGGRDVEIHAAWPADHHPKGHSHETVVVHWNGDRCYTERGRVELASAPPLDARRLERAALRPALEAAARRRERAEQP